MTRPRHPSALVDELVDLWPLLDDATDRATGAPTGPRVSGGGGPSSRQPPVDVDAYDRVDRLVDDVHALAADVSRFLGDPVPATRTLLGHLAHLPNQYDRLRVQGSFAQAAYLRGCLLAWLGDVRRLVGLSVPDRRLGEHCPLHDDPMTELVVPGDQGQLVERAVGVDASGRTVRRIMVDWVTADAVTCRHCGGVWAPGPRYLALVRLLDEADQRRLAAAEQVDDPPDTREGAA